jgi:ribose 5-phosphate isomerase B
LVGLGHQILDVGAHDIRPADYPDSVEALALAIGDGTVERGIAICGSGVGACVAACATTLIPLARVSSTMT